MTRISDGRMIRYVISLLRETVTEWSVINTDESRRIIFRTYEEFKTTFLKWFTDSNSSGTTVKRLLNLRQERMEIQEFVTKVVTLIHRVILRDQTTKVLIFRDLHSKDQDRVMLINSIKIKNELNVKTIDQYLRRVTILIRKNEVRRRKWRFKNSKIKTVQSTT